MLTNHHVVDGCASLQVKRIGGVTESASLVAADDKNDLAVLVVDSTPPQVARFRLVQRVRQGEKVYAYGFPWSGALASGGNMTDGTVSALAGVGDDTRYLQITSPIQPGNSGGPLVGEGGRVIGVVTSKLNALKVAGITGDIPQNVNFALKDSIAKNFLDANDIPYETAAPEDGLSTSDIADRVRAFTIYVVCMK